MTYAFKVEKEVIMTEAIVTTKYEEEFIIRALENYIRWMTDDLRERSKILKMKERMELMECFNHRVYDWVISATKLMDEFHQGYDTYNIIIKHINDEYVATLRTVQIIRGEDF